MSGPDEMEEETKDKCSLTKKNNQQEESQAPKFSVLEMDDDESIVIDLAKEFFDGAQSDDSDDVGLEESI
jgi:hypothetical protein